MPRTRADGLLHEEVCPSIWSALDRAEYHVEMDAERVEPVAITTPIASFDKAQIMALLEVWTDPALLKRQVGE